MTQADHRPYAVIDLDGVVADVRHRVHHLDRRPKDWGAFFAGMAADPVLAVGAAVAEQLAEDCLIVWLTGRPESYRSVTEEWLRAQGLPDGRLIMRAAGDRRPARRVKVERLRALAAERPVAVHVDDDPAVVAAVRAAGFEAVHADWMTANGMTGDDLAAEETLFDAQEGEGRT
jgi:hypothetical protein